MFLESRPRMLSLVVQFIVNNTFFFFFPSIKIHADDVKLQRFVRISTSFLVFLIFNFYF
jgi:hypothetical protein